MLRFRAGVAPAKKPAEASLIVDLVLQRSLAANVIYWLSDLKRASSRSMGYDANFSSAPGAAIHTGGPVPPHTRSGTAWADGRSPVGLTVLAWAQAQKQKARPCEPGFVIHWSQPPGVAPDQSQGHMPTSGWQAAAVEERPAEVRPTEAYRRLSFPSCSRPFGGSLRILQAFNISETPEVAEDQRPRVAENGGSHVSRDAVGGTEVSDGGPLDMDTVSEIVGDRGPGQG